MKINDKNKISQERKKLLGYYYAPDDRRIPQDKVIKNGCQGRIILGGVK